LSFFLRSSFFALLSSLFFLRSSFFALLSSLHSFVGRFLMLMHSKGQNKISEFKLKLMEIEGEQLGIPETEYKVKVTLPSNEFQRICRDLNAFGDTVTVTAEKEGVKFSVSGDLGAGSITIRETGEIDVKEQESVVIELDETVSLTFALKYLSNFTKATPLSSHVSLNLSADVPLNCEYKIGSGDGGAEIGYIRFYLAPKIEDDS
jgi:proliferating cell nuclear antigen